MIYAMADIHGQYDEYMTMLEKIKFSDDDALFVLGDVIDRGPHGIKILQDMMMRFNVYPILGNHEYMAQRILPWLIEDITEESIENIDEQNLQALAEWMANGGESTMEEFHDLSRDDQEGILDYLSDFALYETLRLGGHDFVLVPGGLDNFSEARPLDDYSPAEVLFTRPDYSRIYFKDKFLVTGHTPTRLIHARVQGLDLEDLDEEGFQDKIYMASKHIGIDCGSVFGGRLGCICLDTFEEFYV